MGAAVGDIEFLLLLLLAAALLLRVADVIVGAERWRESVGHGA